jgi:hypothetical protein
LTFISQQLSTPHSIFPNAEVLSLTLSLSSPSLFHPAVLSLCFTILLPSYLTHLLHLGPEQLIYTSHPWLIQLYLDCPPNMNLHCPNATAVKNFQEGIEQGIITWHAGPFNLQPENMDSSLFLYGLTIAEDLR